MEGQHLSSRLTDGTDGSDTYRWMHHADAQGLGVLGVGLSAKYSLSLEMAAAHGDDDGRDVSAIVRA